MAEDVKLNSTDTSDVEKYQRELIKKRNTFGKTINRTGREIILNLEIFERMRDNGTLPKKKDGVNFVDFTPLSEKELAEITEKNQTGKNKPAGKKEEKAK